MMRHLRRECVAVGRHRIRRLMRLMGMEATFRRPRTSAANPEHRIFPYLLRGLDISRADQVWCADITYVPVTQGFFVAVMDWATRHVLAWRLSNTMDASFCVGALDDTFVGATPEILNHRPRLAVRQSGLRRPGAGHGRGILDGRAGYLDNIFIERLWRSLKYEAVYLHDLRDGLDAAQVIGSWFDLYNHVRPNSALGGRTPGGVYRDRRRDRVTRADIALAWAGRLFAVCADRRSGRDLRRAAALRLPTLVRQTGLVPAPHILEKLVYSLTCFVVFPKLRANPHQPASCPVHLQTLPTQPLPLPRNHAVEVRPSPPSEPS